MKRRSLLGALACWPAARLLAQAEGEVPRHKISAARLHEALSRRFPVRFELPGVIELQLSAPALLLLPSRNQLGATLVAQATSPALRRPQSGELDLMFGLRYEASDRTLRAHDMELRDLRLPGLREDSVRALRGVLPRLARDAMGEVVLHRFTPRELALADTMGVEPQTLQVVEDGVMVVFALKRP